jgi:hypothetical protein
MSLVFDHTKNSLSEAMGMSEADVINLSERLSEITKTYLTDPECTLKSQIAENVALQLSYTELVFLATHRVEDAAKEVVEKFSSPLKSLEDLLETFKEMKKDDENED